MEKSRSLRGSHAMFYIVDFVAKEQANEHATGDFRPNQLPNIPLARTRKCANDSQSLLPEEVTSKP
jgi:hypothetical protein